MGNMTLFTQLAELLRMESRYCTEDGVLLKNAIVEDALALHPQLLQNHRDFLWPKLQTWIIPCEQLCVVLSLLIRSPWLVFDDKQPPLLQQHAGFD